MQWSSYTCALRGRAVGLASAAKDRKDVPPVFVLRSEKPFGATLLHSTA